jgi:hypothetical protein
VIPKSFDQVTREDIQNLVTEGRAERRTLEYKQSLPNLGLEQDKYEFLSDVASLANASGGDILFGVVDKRDANKQPTGIPESAPGVSLGNADAAIRQLEQTVRSHIDPKVPGFQMKAIPGFPNGPVVVACVPRSFLAGLHLVRNDKNWVRFYSRGSTGKHLLDATEIRSAFALSESLPDRFRRFRDERVARIFADETPVPLRPQHARVVLHVLPVGSFDPSTRVDLSGLPYSMHKIRPLGGLGADGRFNFDGWVTYRTHTYTQLFRHGAIEAVDSSLWPVAVEVGKPFRFGFYEKMLIEELDAYLKLQQELGLQAPVFILLTLIGVKGWWLITDRGNAFHHAHAIDRDVLLLPEVLVEDYAQRAEAILRPIFDQVWQSSGWGGSPNYDNKDGRWVQR